MILLPIINLYLKSHAESGDIKHSKTLERYLFWLQFKMPASFQEYVPFSSSYLSSFEQLKPVARALQHQPWRTTLVIMRKLQMANYL
jgi:hypothetical protein